MFVTRILMPCPAACWLRCCERSAGRAIAGGAGALGAAADGCWATAGLALAACALGAAVCLLWLACGPARRWLGLATAGPAAAGRRPVPVGAVRWLDGDWRTVLGAICCGWCHGCCLFCARRRQRDPRLTVVARTLGWGSTRIFWLLTLTRPLLTATAVGFSVSIAQYLPTLWLGLAEFRRSPGGGAQLAGEAQTLAAQALWQLLLPAVCFTLTALLARLAGRYRRGLR